MNTDDPHFTACVLRETDHLAESERAHLEAALASDPALAAESEELQRFTAALRAELQSEAAASLTAEQRAELFSANLPVSLAAAGSQIRPRRWWRQPWIAAGAAACLIAGLSFAIYHQVEHVRHLKPEGKRALTESSIQLSTEFAADGTPPSAPMESSLPIAVNAPASDLGSTRNLAAQSGLIDLSKETKPASLPPDRLAIDGQLGSSLLTANPAADPTGMDGTTPLLKATPVAPQPSVPAAMAGRMGGSARNNATAVPAKPGSRGGYAVVDRLASASGTGKASGGQRSDLMESASAGDAVSREKRKTELSEQLAQITETMSTLGFAMITPDDALPTLEAKETELKSDLARLDADGAAREQKESVREELAGLARARESIKSGAALEAADIRKIEEHVRALTAELQSLDQNETSNTEAYDAITDNPFLAVKEQPLSTFSIDVDTASYANVRRFLNTNQLPPKGAVRIEELVNYFTYDYPRPEGDDPFSCTLEAATCPWQPEHRLVRIGLKGRELARDRRPAANLVFLVDVSGSMQPANKLPLVKESLRMLVDQLGEEDSVAIAVYAGASGCVLEPTRDKAKIRAALDRLESGGSTNGAAGIQLAYDLAQRAFKKGGANRVILLTDGDFNVGMTDQSQLVSMIESKAKTGIFLSVLGFGMGNLKDSTLEKLADKGNGNYAYIDTLKEGRRVFVEQVAGTLFTIAKDVKVQVEFNPAQVGAYRLIGYENRLLAKEDFNDDTKDAGEIGAGHSVTALYEIVPAGKALPAIAPVDELKYQQPSNAAQPAEAKPAAGELLTVKLRYKQPDGGVSKKLEFPLTDNGAGWEQSSRDFRWASAVAGFGMMLRDSPHKGSASWALVEELATEGRGDDGGGYRAEFVGLIEKARALSRQ